jgi:hypothetical protein
LAGAPHNGASVDLELRTLNFERRNTLTQVIFFLNEETMASASVFLCSQFLSSKFYVGMRFPEDF